MKWLSFIYGLALFLAVELPAEETALPTYTVEGEEGGIVKIGEKEQTFCRFKVTYDKSSHFNIKLDSGVSHWSDNTGTDLGKKEVNAPRDYTSKPNYFSVTGSFGSQTITLTSPIQANPAAESFTVEGILLVEYAGKPVEGSIPNLELKKDAKFILAGQEFTITGIETNDDRMKLPHVTLHLKYTTPNKNFCIEELQFVGPNNRSLALTSNSSSTQTTGGAIEHSTIYCIKPHQGNPELKYKVWTDLKMIQIPYKVTVPVKKQ